MSISHLQVVLGRDARRVSEPLGNNVQRELVRQFSFPACPKILEQLRPEDALSRLELFLDYAPDIGFVDVPDPYFGNAQDFARVFDMIEATTQRLLDHILKVHNLDIC